MKAAASYTLLLLCLLGTTLPAAAGFQKTKIAILDFQLQGEGFETKDMGAIVAEWFITAFVGEGRFEVVERAMLARILEEQKLGQSGIIDEKTVSQIGKLLGVKVIITGTVMRLQGITEINARIIDIQTASITAAENVKSGTATRLQELVVIMAERLIKNFPLEGYIVKRDKKNVTLDLGKFAGVKPGMRFLVFREGNAIKHPKTGEVLDVERIVTGEVRIFGIQEKISEGDITRETTPDAIQYGQLVSSIAGPLKPVSPPPETPVASVQGQTRPASAESKKPAVNPKKDAPPKADVPPPDPARLEGEINRALRNGDAGGVTAQVNDDFSVLLKGTSTSKQQKDRASQIVRQFPGVGSVKDRIFVVEQ